MTKRRLGKGEARHLASEIVAGKQSELWEALCDVYEITEETCTIARPIEILQDAEPEYINPLIH